VYLANIGLRSGTINPSSIGLLQARGQVNNWSGDNYHENLYVNMSSNPAANSGIGTIGVVNLDGSAPLLRTSTKAYSKRLAENNLSVCGYFSAVFSSQHLSWSGQYFGAGLCGHIV
jgi:hypothetical protein